MARGGQKGDPVDWVSRAADDAVRHAGEGKPVTVSSGASPSGPVHLGNLREFLTTHFVADELRRRGLEVRHLHVWDDFDRFRKVPAGVPASWSEHIGRPLTAVPDPWECHASWADHFKEPLQQALAALGVEMDEISQTELYRAGTYRDSVLQAVRARDEIDAVLARYRTKKAAPPAADSEPASDIDAQEAAALAESVAADDDFDADLDGSGDNADLARFPYKPYCRECGRDTVTLTSYDDDSTDLGYRCDCGFEGVTNLTTQFEGKLVWKVDWPMRWAFYHVDFEAAGADHATPGSSFTVGHELVAGIFDMPKPAWFGYGFVGFAGMQKMSSSSGGVPTAADALRVLEAPILRWLYVRRAPKQAFTIDFGPEVLRLYDEWDALGRKAADPAKRDVAVLAWERAAATADGPLPTPEVTVPFRTLSSVADVTAGSADLISRTISDVGFPHTDVAALEPRLGRAMAWTEEFVPESDRTVVRSTPDADRLAALTEDEELWLRIFLDRLPDSADLAEVTSLVYGVPKAARGLGFDDAPTDQVKADQKDFFRLLYNLLVSKDRGPRLPTLVVALGPEKVRSLLTPPA
ncbi:lysine--tRNA ligase [Nocardioides seonyuensis]|uniref:Lysine--tRNA ligase n=1 Tax=Nocardioides seonyuensis TaxID=2518371 RepID=A0A4P7IFZ9_9ACTN|nr:lysine--tRNA ligase [Nocardioides seonyuensis]QBX55760.1 lysine--tRNA ligase [Nocardioides seonyuensis]